MNVVSTYPTVDTQGNDIKEWYIGGGYDFQVVKVVASYQTLNNSNSAATSVDNKVWSVGAIVPVSAAGKIRLEYAQTKFSQSGIQPVEALQTNGSSKGWGVGYTHDLSKRTMLYTNYSYITNGQDSMDFGANGVGVRGESNYTVTAGIKHSF
jgi:predicted porin